jgi:sulfate adenylyltransferase (ADP) / ATP adenylyltransferase
VVRVLTGSAPNAPDPFLPPYDPRLHVADLGPFHALLLNKYPVLDGHLLIVTRRWAPQTAFPDPEDFAATAPLLHGRPALAFYNGGPESGASQPHRHFQAVTLPLGPVPAAIPTAAWIEQAAAGAPLPFPGAAAKLPAALWSEPDPGKKLHATASELLRRSGRDPSAPGSFNLLFTTEWMLAVPRTRRRFGGVSVNSLGYAGALIAKTGEGLDTLSARGPLAVLTGAASNNI